MVTLRLEDQGQDFLEWDVKPMKNGRAKIVGCRPFQGFVWVGKIISGYGLGQRPFIHRGRLGGNLLYKVVGVTRRRAKRE